MRSNTNFGDRFNCEVVKYTVMTDFYFKINDLSLERLIRANLEHINSFFIVERNGELELVGIRFKEVF